MSAKGRRTAIRAALAVSGVVIATSALAQLAGDHGPGRNFERADADKNGAVSWAEAETMHQSKFRMVDLDGDGAVSRDEMIAALTQKVVARASKRFDRVDRNGDGRISEAEFAAVSALRFSSADADGDGQVTREELRQRMRAHRLQKHERENE